MTHSCYIAIGKSMRSVEYLELGGGGILIERHRVLCMPGCTNACMHVIGLYACSKILGLFSIDDSFALITRLMDYNGAFHSLASVIS
jgi:hypothetical protein